MKLNKRYSRRSLAARLLDEAAGALNALRRGGLQVAEVAALSSGDRRISAPTLYRIIKGRPVERRSIVIALELALEAEAAGRRMIYPPPDAPAGATPTEPKGPK